MPKAPSHRDEGMVDRHEEAHQGAGRKLDREIREYHMGFYYFYMLIQTGLAPGRCRFLPERHRVGGDARPQRGTCLGG